MRKALITGGAGFIGSNTVDLFLERGYDVAIIDNLSTGYEKNLNPKARFYDVDLRDEKISEVFQKETPDVLVHLAAQIDVRKSIKDPAYDANINILGSINLIKNAVEAKVKKIVYASSGGAVYGEPKANPVTEDHSVKPLCPYGASKYCVEKYLEMLCIGADTDYTILRYGNVYGPRQDPLGEAGVVAIFSNKIFDGVSPEIYGDGEQTRDFCYVKDIARANLIASEKNGKAKVYNVGSGAPTSVNLITQKLIERINPGIKAVYTAPILGEVRHIYLETSLIDSELGWIPKTSLDEGIDGTIKWLSIEKSGI